MTLNLRLLVFKMDLKVYQYKREKSQHLKWANLITQMLVWIKEMKNNIVE